jgi:hypothetical protein
MSDAKLQREIGHRRRWPRIAHPDAPAPVRVAALLILASNVIDVGSRALRRPPPGVEAPESAIPAAAAIAFVIALLAFGIARLSRVAYAFFVVVTLAGIAFTIALGVPVWSEAEPMRPGGLASLAAGAMTYVALGLLLLPSARKAFSQALD